MGTRESFKRRIILDWVNTLPLDSCLLVSDISEFETGEVLCDIANFVLNNARQGHFWHRIARNSRIDSIYNNWELLLTSFDIFSDFQEIPIEEIIKNEEILLEIITAIYDYHNNHNENDAKTIPIQIKPSLNSEDNQTEEMESNLGRRSLRKSAKNHSVKISPEVTYINPQNIQKRFHSSYRGRWTEKKEKMGKRSHSERRLSKETEFENENHNLEDDMTYDELNQNQKEAFTRKTQKYNKQLLRKSSRKAKSSRRKNPIEMAKKHLSNKNRESLRKASISKISKLNKKKSVKRKKRKLSVRTQGNSKTRRKKRRGSIKPMEKPKDVTIDQVTPQEVKKVKNWMLDHLFCSSITDFKILHTQARNGGFIFDLINKIERKAVLKGKNVSNPTSIKVNYKKIMKHLKQYEKFNPRYFNAAYYLINGHYEVFWGFLLDIYYYYHNKISIYDRRYSRKTVRTSQRNNRNRQIEDYSSRSPDFEEEENTKIWDVERQNKTEEPYLFYQNYSQSTKNLEKEGQLQFHKKHQSQAKEIKKDPSNGKITTLSALIDNNQIDPSVTEHLTFVENLSISPSNYHAYHPSTKSYVNDQFVKITESRTPVKRKRGRKNRGNDSYMRSFIKKKRRGRNSRITPSGSILVERRTANSRFVDIEVEKSVIESKAAEGKIDYKNLLKLENSMKKWLKSLGFTLSTNSDLFEDPIRNGYILCLLVSKIYECNISRVCKKPKTIRECMRNVETAFVVIRENKEDFPFNLLWKTENIVQGDPSVIWPLFSSLKTVLESSNPNFISQKSEQISSKMLNKLPYTHKQIQLLQDSLLLWFISLGLFSRDQLLPATFEEVITRVSDGVFLVRLTEVVLNKKLKGIHWRPNGRSNCIHNIRKALDELRKERRMSRRFLWKIEKIFDRDFFTCLGLFEDIHLYYDGHPRRKDPDYFKNGPYIVKSRSVFQDSEDLDNLEKRLENQVGGSFKTSQNNANPLSQFTRNQDETKSNFTTPIIQNFEKNSMINKPVRSEMKNQGNSYYEHGFKSEINFSGLKQGDKKSRRNLSEYNGALGQTPVMLDTFAKTETFSTGALDLIATEDLEGYDSNNENFEPLDFSKIKKVVRLLVYLDMPKIIERETWDSTTWTQFSDGIVLSAVIAKLSNKEVPHIQSNPRTSAACLNNIRRCLAFLQRASNKVNPNHLLSEDKILKGNPASISQIFDEIYKAFPFAIQRIEKKRYSTKLNLKKRVNYSANKYREKRDEHFEREDKLNDINLIQNRDRKEFISHPRNAF